MEEKEMWEYKKENILNKKNLLSDDAVMTYFTFHPATKEAWNLQQKIVLSIREKKQVSGVELSIFCQLEIRPVTSLKC